MVSASSSDAKVIHRPWTERSTPLRQKMYSLGQLMKLLNASFCLEIETCFNTPPDTPPDNGSAEHDDSTTARLDKSAERVRENLQSEAEHSKAV